MLDDARRPRACPRCWRRWWRRRRPVPTALLRGKLRAPDVVVRSAAAQALARAEGRRRGAGRCVRPTRRRRADADLHGARGDARRARPARSRRRPGRCSTRRSGQSRLGGAGAGRRSAARAEGAPTACAERDAAGHAGEAVDERRVAGDGGAAVLAARLHRDRQGHRSKSSWPCSTRRSRSRNFVTLARKGFFNGVAFHRVVPRLRRAGRRPARRRRRRSRATPFATRSTSGRTCAAPSAWRSTGGHRRQPVLHHALAGAAPRRALHRVRPRGGRDGRRRPHRCRGIVIRRVRIRDGVSE